MHFMLTIIIGATAYHFYYYQITIKLKILNIYYTAGYYGWTSNIFYINHITSRSELKFKRFIGFACGQYATLFSNTIF